MKLVCIETQGNYVENMLRLIAVFSFVNMYNKLNN